METTLTFNDLDRILDFVCENLKDNLPERIADDVDEYFNFSVRDDIERYLSRL